MAIFPFKKEEKVEEGTGFLVSSETENKGEISTKEKIYKNASLEQEKTKETTEKEGVVKEQPSVSAPAQVQTEGRNVVPAAPITKTQTLLELEQILSENLDDLYTSLTPEQKIVFKQKGEEAASKIELLMGDVKTNIDKILTLIKEWLLLLAQMIPGVNKIFLIKEAKIKTDKILFLRNKEKK
jgi:hypothetical protein